MGSDDHQEGSSLWAAGAQSCCLPLAASAENLVDLPPEAEGPWGSQHLLLLVVGCLRWYSFPCTSGGPQGQVRVGFKLQREPTGEKCGCRVEIRPCALRYKNTGSGWGTMHGSPGKWFEIVPTVSREVRVGVERATISPFSLKYNLEKRLHQFDRQTWNFVLHLLLL